MSTRRGKQSTTVKMKHTNPTPTSQNLTKTGQDTMPKSFTFTFLQHATSNTGETLASHNLNKDHSIPSPNPASSVQESQPPNPGHCSPPKKATKEPTTNNTVIGYVHNLSPSKRNKRNTLDYSTFTLQVGETSMQEALCYSKTKRSILSEKETSRIPVKIAHFAKNLRRHKAETLNQVLQELQVDDATSPTDLEITVSSIDTIEHIVKYKFLKEVTNTVCDKTIEQPTTQTVRDNILLTRDPSHHISLSNMGKEHRKAIAQSEYETATTSLEQDGFGRIIEFRVPRARGSCKVFVKSKPNPWPSCMNVSVQEFENVIANPSTTTSQLL
ncbi:hypothetical protein OS493_027263 [Desmophyllum pertusum]|uniref:Uncharacterized protein n=1 Tax=Desmophyllum pertusum TaxID=174260 RepID=A0A9W9Z9K6_9CNID|nr:hypothetical protein OS493_027263 [Desmophyllum pertusum]